MATLSLPQSDPSVTPLDTTPRVWNVSSFGMTDTGHVRKRNEDHFLIAELTKTLHVHHTSLP